MTSISLAFLAGILFLQFFSFLPSLKWIAVSLVFCVLIYSVKLKMRQLIIVFLLGFSWCLWYAHSIASFSLPQAWEGRALWIRGKIVSLPRILPHRTSFLFYLDQVQVDKISYPVSTRVSLSLPQSNLRFEVGDEWLFPARLKKIHASRNPGGIDYEAWAFQNGIRASAYVLEKEKPVFISGSYLSQPMNRLRQYIQEQAKIYIPPSSTSAWILALMIGERAGIPQKDWEVLRNTGTNHLMAIAGLHIGFMSALAHIITCCIWRLFPQWMLLLPTPQAGACSSLLIALFYSGLAGFSIPTQRALLMLSLFLLTTLLRRVIPLWQAWSLALFIVLALNPLTVLSSSFWLSFTTLALIIYGVNGRLAPQGWWWKWGRPQWVISLGLLPLSLWLFTQYSLVSFLANFIAIPWVGFLVLPLCFLSVVLLLICPAAAHLTLMLADQIFALLWTILSWFSQFSWGLWQQVLPHYGYLAAGLCGVFILLVPSGFPGRFLGICWLFPLIFFRAQTPDFGELRFTLLDVGQGLSAVLQTQHHSLVFDAGLRLGPEFDMGESVVLPFLRSQGIRQIDSLVISHGDNDHSGGALAILRHLPVIAIKSSVPSLFPAWPASYCLAGDSWVWDGVRFTFLHPEGTELNQGNNSSCVLQVETGHKRILLTGDIEKPAEYFLLRHSNFDLRADLMVAPHHGSKTSGLPEFIGKVGPQYILYAIGYRNRYHFPHPSVVQAYRDWGSIQYDTVSSGAIQFRVKKDSLSPPLLYRRIHKRYWND